MPICGHEGCKFGGSSEEVKAHRVSDHGIYQAGYGTSAGKPQIVISPTMSKAEQDYVAISQDGFFGRLSVTKNGKKGAKNVYVFHHKNGIPRIGPKKK